ncbi:MAG: DUF1963 domain-containing protein [Neisseriaceae bacterium]|nr:DUF1963 domain-containing protein [Neisseriaceae bacterium]
MNTQQDFELTAEEIDELKKFLAYPDVRINSSAKKPDFSVLNEPLAMKNYLLKIRNLGVTWNSFAFLFGSDDDEIIKLPDSIQYLTNLEHLWFFHLPFETLPEQIGQFKKLRRLDLFGCAISTLPESIGQLSELTELHIDSCQALQTLPNQIGQLKKLRTLHLYKSGITTLPESIGELSELTQLNLNGCFNLCHLPNGMAKLNQLKKMVISGFGRAPLNHLDPIKALPNLKKLHIGGLPNLTALPENMSKLNSLQQLEISQCFSLSTLPESLAQLPKLINFEIIECNSLQTIPEQIKQLTCFACYANRSEQYEKTKNRRRILSDEEKQAQKVLSQMKKDTATPIIKIKPKKAKKLSLTASKFGGVPYWDLQKPYPVDKNGEKLALLAQIDLAELPPLPDFPTTGLLQFFISNDDVAGLDFDNPLSQTGWRVVYHTSVDKNITEKQVLQLNIPLENMPLGDTQYQLSFDLGSQSMGLADYRFEKLFKTTAEKLKIEFDEDDELLDLIEEEAYDRLYNSTAGHHIGGYPFFTQDDPRSEEQLAGHNILLLQIDSKNGILWGDAGVGNFFITADDLKKRDFSRVLYHWDCA